MESRLQRLKQEVPVIEQHNKNLEDKETICKQLSAETQSIAGSEVSRGVNLKCVPLCEGPCSCTALLKFDTSSAL